MAHRRAHGEQIQEKAASAGPEDVEALRVLNKGVKWTEDGVVYERDYKHADRLIEEGEAGQRPGVRHARDMRLPQGPEEREGDNAERPRRRGGRPHTSAGQTGAGRGGAPGRTSNEMQNGQNIEARDVGERRSPQARAGQIGPDAQCAAK